MEMGKHKLIVDIARSLFALRGVRSVTMSEIAQYCAISKKTLYQEFEDKEKLIQTIVGDTMSEFLTQIRKVPCNSMDAMIEMQNYFECFVKLTDAFTPLFMNDMHKSYISLYRQILTDLDFHMSHSMELNILRGVKENCYRDNVDIHGLMDWLLWHLHSLINDTELQEKNVRHYRIFFENTLFHRYLAKIT